MYSPTPMPTMAMKNKKRNEIALQVEAWVMKNGEIPLIPTINRGVTPHATSEVEQKSQAYAARVRA